MLQDLQKTIGIDGAPVTTVCNTLEKCDATIYSWPRGESPSYQTKLQEHFPTVKLAGSSFEGISIPECVQQGKQVANEVLMEMFK